MKKLAITVIDKNITILYGMPCCTGKIRINSFKETFDMLLEWWTQENY